MKASILFIAFSLATTGFAEDPFATNATDGVYQEPPTAQEKNDLKTYLDEGQQYLREGDFDRAAESFNAAVVIDPSNRDAVESLKAIEDSETRAVRRR